jgi:hypothetical protein
MAAASAWRPVEEDTSAWKPVQEDRPDFAKNPPAMPDHRADAAKDMHEVFDPTMARYKPRSTDEQFSDIGLQLGEAVEPAAKSLYQISAPGVGVSLAKEKYPGIATYIPEAMKRDAAPLEKLPGQIAVNGLMMLAGAGEETPAPEARPAEPSIARPTPRTESIPTEKPSTIISRAVDVAKRRASHIPGVQAVKDTDYILRGPKEAPATPAPTIAKPAPVPETNGIRWGTGGDVPLEQRGKMIPPEPPELTSESRTLPGMHSPEVVRPKIASPKPILRRPGLMLKEGDTLAPFRDQEIPPHGPAPELEGHADILKERVSPPDTLSKLRGIEPPARETAPEIEGHSDILKERVSPPKFRVKTEKRGTLRIARPSAHPVTENPSISSVARALQESGLPIKERPNLSLSDTGRVNRVLGPEEDLTDIIEQSVARAKKQKN